MLNITIANLVTSSYPFNTHIFKQQLLPSHHTLSHLSLRSSTSLSPFHQGITVLEYIHVSAFCLLNTALFSHWRASLSSEVRAASHQYAGQEHPPSSARPQP
ncbi:hypothetical protein A4X13_0g6952 [Tilletia indica]|uniref:Uncharacterized protein n=1 Tax=Tilletia indica TaxID=43049 RepID=A0A177TII6_9BASI|nr:hypothetical protein A4X13_0g6952 [Tilletia indica]